MNYRIEKKLNLDNFKKIKNGKITSVEDKYIWIKNEDDSNVIIDINGKTIASYSYGTSFKYIKNGFFLDIPYDELLMDNVYKENYRINNIHNIKFYSDIKVGIDAFNNMILLDNNGFKKSKLYSYIYNFSNNYAPVKDDTKRKPKYGIIDSTGREVIDVKYDYISEFNNHHAVFKINNKWGIINDDLQITISNIKCKKLIVVDNNKMIIEKRGKTLITDFNKNVIYKLNDNEKYVIDYNNKNIYIYDINNLNRKGKQKLDNKNVNSFVNYLTITNSSINNYDMVLIDEYNNVNNIKDFGIKEMLSNDIFKYDNDCYGLINLKTNNNKYHSITYTNNGIYIVSIYNSYGLINKDGSVILPLIYDEIKYFKLDDFYIACTSTQTLLDKNGNKIHEFSNNEDIIQHKNNMTVVKSDNYILYDNEFKEIVSSKEKVFILDNNKIILENHLIDLDLEYISFDYVYELVFNYKNKELKYSFDNMKDLCEFLNQIELINTDYDKKIDELKAKEKDIIKEINEIENKKIAHVKKKKLCLKNKL